MKNADRKVVLFDLDGTLTDPGLGITNSVMYALEKFGLKIENREIYYKFIGPPLIDSFKKYYSVSDEAAVKLVSLYREYFSVKGLLENEVYDGVHDMLQGLKSQGVILCLATSKPEAFSLRILDAFGLNKYFDYAACSTMDDTRTRKTDVVSYALELVGCGAGDSNVIMVGDREFDVIGAHENGLRAIGVTYGYGTREELAECGAEYIVDSVSDLTKLLNTF